MSDHELLAIHEAVMNPMDVKITGSETYTVRRVKEFILRAVSSSPDSASPATRSGS